MGKIVFVVAIFAGIAGWAHYSKVLPDFRGGSGLNFESAGSRSGDIRVDTPHGKRYAGMAYWGETTMNGKRYTTITTYRSK